MSEPQVWTIIGVLSAGLFGVLTLVTTLFTRFVTATGEKITAQVSEKITSEVGRLERKIDGLDRDVQGLTRRVFGEEPHG